MDQHIQHLFTEAIVLEAATHYGVAADQLTFIGGFQNHVYEFPYDGRSYVLRFTHSSHRAAAMIRGEVDWINYLVDHNLPVARAVSARDGDAVKIFPVKQGYFVAVAFEKAPGAYVKKADWGPDLFRAMGKLMGRMHRLTKDYVPSTSAIKRREWYEESEGFAEQCLPSSEQDAIDKFNAVGAYLRTLPIGRECYGLVHTDVQASNFFLHNGQITLFDFDDCQYSWFVDDIAMALFYVVLGRQTDAERVTQARAFLNSFLPGYYSENGLDPTWFAQVPHFLKARELGVYAAIYAHCGGDFTELDEWGRAYLTEHKDKIARNVPYLDIDFTEIAYRYA